MMISGGGSPLIENGMQVDLIGRGGINRNLSSDRFPV